MFKVTNVYVIGLFATIGGLLFGCDISSMSGLVSNTTYMNYFGVADSPAKAGAVVAVMSAGSFVGALVAGVLSDKIGRKETILISAICWIVGSTLMCAAQNLGMLIVGRIINGLSVGGASMVVPVYQSEIAPRNIRGRIVSFQQWAITWGILIQYLVQFGSSYVVGADTGNTAVFRIPWGIQMVWGIGLAIFILGFPQSPRWLADKDRWDECLNTLADLHGRGDVNNEEVQFEYREIQAAVKFDREQGANSYIECFKGGYAGRTFLGMCIQMWSQLTGMNVMMYYITYVFQGAGLTGTTANLTASLVQYILNVLLTIPAILYLDRWGRRPTLIYGGLAMAFFLFIVGAIMGARGHAVVTDNPAVNWSLDPNDRSSSIALIVMIYLFVCSFATSWGPCSWTYPAEIFPLRIRSKAVALATATNWAFNTGLAEWAPPMMQSINYKAYFFYACMNLAAAIHVFFACPETKGRTLEEVDALFTTGVAPWKSKSIPHEELAAKLEQSAETEKAAETA
ncbi:general substrate transporter [Umbelopsis sp. PMI_123]|nr:general substrate transporter [Umbelopsis sp. PMI_123]